MKVMKASVLSSLFIIGGSACAEDVNGKWCDKIFDGFAKAGIADSDITLNSSSVASGSYTYTESVDKNGTMLKLEFGVSIAKNAAVEIYGGRLSGFSNTATLTASNAVIGGYTLNGSLTGVEEFSAELAGVSLVLSDRVHFSNDNTMSYFGRVGLAEVDLVDTVTFIGSGTVDGVAVSSTVAVSTFTENGTKISLGAGVSYTTQGIMMLSAAADYMPNVGGRYVQESNITSLTVSTSKSF